MKKINFLFYGSIFFGIFIWFFFFIITPIEIIKKVSFFTISFISLSYIALISGYIMTPFILNTRFKYFGVFNRLKVNRYFILKTLITLVLVAFVFRYFDLFVNREVKFTNPTYLNKVNASNPENFSLLVFFLSFFRVLFFVPLIFYFAIKLDKNKILYICVFLFLLPFLEAYLRGSRRLVFESLGLLIIILFIFNKIDFRSFRVLMSSIITTVILFGFSLSVLKGRISQNTNEFYSKIFDSQYNRFTPPQKEAVKFIQENNNILGHAYFSEIHLGQYITHGVFEMDYMISTQPKHLYGKFTSYSIVKFFNKLGISNISLNSLNNPTKRITYITFFGGMFLDFGWYALAFMFFFGMIQNKILLLSRKNYILLPIGILLLFSNIFMLIFNFFRTQFVFSLTVYFLFVVLIFIVFKSKASHLISRN